MSAQPTPAVTEPASTSSPSAQADERRGCASDDSDRGWGLHCTDEELAVWRRRAVHGPFRVANDHSTHTPGDWERIEDNARTFLGDPELHGWDGPDGDGCVSPAAEAPTEVGASALRDAAFRALVVGDRSAARTVADALLRHARRDALDFDDAERWCAGRLHDLNPGFEIANWLTKLLYGYDYVGPRGFTDREVAELDDWFAAAARFFAAELDSDLDPLFADRAAGRLSDELREEPYCGRSLYVGGPVSCRIHRSYNNRRASMARFVGLVGIHQQDAELQRTAARFVEELVTYSIFPDGSMGEFERWDDRLPDLGWAYATQTLAAAVTVADAFARAGDPSLYEFETSEGAYGTEGGPRSLLGAVRAIGGYVDGTYDRYAGEEDGAGDPSRLIDGSHDGWQSLHDISLAPVLRYAADPYLQAMVLRTGRGMPPYPEEPAPIGRHPVWTGDSGTYPAVLFMFADLPDSAAS